MCEKLSNQIIHTLAVNQAVFLLIEVCKNHEKRKRDSVCSSKQRGDALLKFM